MRQPRVMSDYLWLPAVVLGFVLGFALVAGAQTPVATPYKFTPDGRLEPTADQKPGTVAALMHEEHLVHGRPIRAWTDATTAGFALPDGNYAGRHLVFRDGPRGAPVYVAAIEGSGDYLSAPAPFDSPFPLDGMTVWHDDIGAPSAQAPAAVPAMGVGRHHHRTYVVQLRYIGKEPGRDHNWHTVSGGTHSSEQAAMNQCDNFNEIAWQHRHGPHQCRLVEND